VELNVDYWTKKKEKDQKEDQSTVKASFSRVSVSRIGRLQNPYALNAIGGAGLPSQSPSFASSPILPSGPPSSSASLPLSYPCFTLSMTYYKDRRQLMRLPKRPSEKEKEKEKDKSHSKVFVVTKMICSASDPNAVLTVSIDSVEFYGRFFIFIFLLFLLSSSCVKGVKFIKLLPFWRSHIQNIPIAKFDDRRGDEKRDEREKRDDF
jgi:hypothetical protein